MLLILLNSAIVAKEKVTTANKTGDKGKLTKNANTGITAIDNKNNVKSGKMTFAGLGSFYL